MLKNIYILDSDLVFLNELKETLEESGYSVIKFLNANNLFQNIKKAVPDAVIFDVNLEGKR